ncbi:MAG: hypothetical protein ICV56_01730 [Nitrososphaeraceae archaeon]|nr:hypothetical protein [Nitrososphaeraceae archaeon]
MKSNINDFFLNISHDVRKHHLNLKLDEPLESIFLESVARNDLTQRCNYESAYLIARCFEISTSDRICTALLEIFIYSIQIFFFMKEKIIDCELRTTDIS